MGRHHVPRPPRRRRLLLGAASLSGVAVMAFLGLTYTHTVNVDIPTPFSSPSTAAPSLASSQPLPPNPYAPTMTEVMQAAVDEVVARAAEVPVETPEPPAPPSPTETPAPESQAVPEPEEVEVAQEVEETTPDPEPEPAVAAASDYSGSPTPTSTSWSAWATDVRPQVADILFRYPVGTVYTRPGHSPDQQHAADFMTSDQAKGDAIAAYALSLPGVEYVIWQQRYNDGSGWELMEDRGGITANHFDHVHVSFY